MGKLTVGQKLWCKAMFGDYEAIVQKVGRKWAHINNPDIPILRSGLRLNVESMEVFHPNRAKPSATAYLSKEALEQSKADEQRQKAAREAWCEFWKNEPRNKPTHVTADAIYQAAALLGIELPARSDTGETK